MVNLGLLYDPAISLLGMYTREMETQSKTETYVLTFEYHYSLITKSRNHPNVPQHVDK